MPATPQPAEPTQPGNTRHRDILDEIIDLGADLARQIHARATAGELPLEAATIAFDRTARAIRRTVTLARHLATHNDDPAKPMRHRTAARTRILRVVEDTIAREPQGPETDRLTAELRERLDAPELEDEIGARPTEDIIADILRDLGLGHIPGFRNHWRRRTPEDLTDLHRRAAGPAAGRRAGATSGHAPHPGVREPLTPGARRVSDQPQAPPPRGAP